MIMKKTANIYRRRFLVLILMGVIIMNAFSLLTGCSVFEADTATSVKKQLNEKYGIEFDVTAMGDRINTGSATLYCIPKGNDTVHFTVIYDYSKKTITDDYLARKNAVEIDEELKDISAESTVDFASLTAFYDADYTSLNGSENTFDFIKKSGATELYIHLAVNADEITDEKSAQEMIDALETISRKYDSIDILAVTFFLKQDEYEKCVEELSKRTAVNDDWFKSYSPISSMNIKLEEGRALKSAADLLLSVKG